MEGWVLHELLLVQVGVFADRFVLHLLLHLLYHRLDPLVEHVQVGVGPLHELGEQGGGGDGFLLEVGLEDHIVHGPLEFVLQDGHAFLEGEVVLGIHELAVHALVGLVDEVHAEVVGVGAALEGLVEGAVRFADWVGRGVPLEVKWAVYSLGTGSYIYQYMIRSSENGYLQKVQECSRAIKMSHRCACIEDWLRWEDGKEGTSRRYFRFAVKFMRYIWGREGTILLG